jgi:hypothetical protein
MNGDGGVVFELSATRASQSDLSLKEAYARGKWSGVQTYRLTDAQKAELDQSGIPHKEFVPASHVAADDSPSGTLSAESNSPGSAPAAAPNVANDNGTNNSTPAAVKPNGAANPSLGATLEIDPDEIKLFLSLIGDSGRLDLKWFDSAFNNGPPTDTWSGRLEKPDAVVKKILQNRKLKWNVYFSNNGMRDDAPDTTTASLAELRCVYIDLDGAENETPEETRARLTPFVESLRGTAAEPSFVVWTGGGVQLFWLLANTPATPEAMKVVNETNIALRDSSGGDQNTGDLARILRHPGTPNWLSPKKRDAGRQPELAKIMYYNRGRRFQLDELPALVDAFRNIAGATGLVCPGPITKTSTRRSAPRTTTKEAKAWKGYRFISTEDAILLINLLDPTAAGVASHKDWQPVVSNILMMTNGDPAVAKRLESWHDGRVNDKDNAKAVRQKLANWKANGWASSPKNAAGRLADKLNACAVKGEEGKAAQMAALLKSIEAQLEYMPGDDENKDYSQLEMKSFADFIAPPAEKTVEQIEALKQAREATPNPDEPNWLPDMNKEWAIVKGNERIAHFKEDGEIEFISREAFNLWGQNRTVTIRNGNRTEQRTITSLWLQHPKRREITQMGLWPIGQQPAGAHNLFKGLTVEPAEGAWPRTQEFIQDVICAGDRKQNEFVLNWIADLLQYPTRKGYTALVLVGDEGVGKSFLAKRIIGAYLHESNWVEITDKRHLMGNFNAHLDNGVYLVGDEALYAGDKDTQGIFKALVTEDRILIEKKKIDVRISRNALTMLFCSNNILKAVPIGEGDRRSTIIQVANHRKEDRAYFEGLEKALNGGERAAFLEAMLKRDLSSYDRRKTLKTAAKLQAIKANAGLTATWWMERVGSGHLPGLDESNRLLGLKAGQTGTDWEKDSVFVATDLMWEDFQSWQRRQGRYQENLTEWGLALNRVCPDRVQCRRSVSVDADDPMVAGKQKRRPRGYTYPPLLRCRELVEKFFGGGEEGE